MLDTARMYIQNKHWWKPSSNVIRGVITEEYSVNVEDAEYTKLQHFQPALRAGVLQITSTSTQCSNSSLKN